MKIFLSRTEFANRPTTAHQEHYKQAGTKRANNSSLTEPDFQTPAVTCAATNFPTPCTANLNEEFGPNVSTALCQYFYILSIPVDIWIIKIRK